MGGFGDEEEDPTWPNVEANADLNTSNESYMSSDDDEGIEENYRFSLMKMNRQSAPPRELSRQEKALVSRRFEPYFRQVFGLTAEEYWRRGRKPFTRS